MASAPEELLALLSSHIESGLTEAETIRVSELLRTDPQLIELYVEYMGLHGLLVWDIASIDDTPAATTLRQPIDDHAHEHRRTQPRRMQLVALMATIAVLIAVPMWWLLSDRPDKSGVVAHQSVERNVGLQNALSEGGTSSNSTGPSPTPPSPQSASTKPEPLSVSSPPSPNDSDSRVTAGTIDEPADWQKTLRPGFTDHTVVAGIDSFLNTSLQENEVEASPRASDSEWVRRAYLTIAGRIPSIAETQRFLVNNDHDKRDMLLDQLLALPERSTNMATIWTNLLIGRVSRPGVDRAKLFQFLHTSFEDNRSWMKIIGQLIKAQGRSDRNGATNFLLAHLNDQATPATAVTSRLFLGQQLNCVQCHNHPFSQQMHQRDYWAFNAFFRDVVRATEDSDSPGEGMAAGVWKLTDRRRAERMTFFENRRGQQIATLPRFDGQSVAADSTANRREVLAEMLATDSESRVARAMVNRMWARFFGYGFTPSVDDMGCDALISHPELLEFLTDAFVASDYDLRRLTKWIAATDAWNRTSEVAVTATIDQPDTGEMPLFSRVYVRRMSPEQVYESIRVAVRSAAGVPASARESSVAHRHRWVQQFASTYGTDENDERLDFGGSITQALVMMNGEDVDQAIQQAAQAVAGKEGRRTARSMDALNRLSLAILTRKPTVGEERAFRRHVRHTAARSTAGKMTHAVEDMMWAYLNSSEFIIIH